MSVFHSQVIGKLRLLKIGMQGGRGCDALRFRVSGYTGFKEFRGFTVGKEELELRYFRTDSQDSGKRARVMGKCASSGVGVVTGKRRCMQWGGTKGDFNASNGSEVPASNGLRSRLKIVAQPPYFTCSSPG